MTSTCTIAICDCSVGVTIHTPLPEADCHTAILYLHGGGLLYGERDDLPAPYLHMFLDAGYTLFCLDYPLAPEASLSLIHQAVLDGWAQLAHEQFPVYGITRHFLFGRSAGAYLALLLAKHLRTEQILPPPVGILDFYGYYDMTDPFFSQPSVYYNRLPAVPRNFADRFLGGPPVTSGPKSQRFSLYVYARQQGAWSALLGAADMADPAYSLSPADIAALPPLFITASSADEDVPFRISKSLSRQAPSAVMKTVYYLEHDFDRDTNNPAGAEVYRACLAWMAGLNG